MYRQYLFIASLALAPLGCGQATGEQGRNPPVPVALSAAEIGRARAVAEKDFAAAPEQGTLLFIKADWLPSVQGQSQTRLVMVQHYRYRNDETLFAMVDLDAEEVVSRETAVHYPTALAAIEIQRALELARADSRLQATFGASGLTHDARPIQSDNLSEPLFGHRVVHVMLKRDGNFLTSPRVLVDLTTATVHLE